MGPGAAAVGAMGAAFAGGASTWVASLWGVSGVAAAAISATFPAVVAGVLARGREWSALAVAAPLTAGVFAAAVGAVGATEATGAVEVVSLTASAGALR